MSDYSNHLIRMVTSSGVVTTIAGQAGISGGVNGIGSNALFYYPRGIAIDSIDSMLYIADSFNYVIRKLSMSTLLVSTYAGTMGSPGTSSALLAGVFGVNIDSSRNVYATDCNNGLLRKISSSGAITTLISGLSSPCDVAFDSTNNIYVASSNNVIYKINTLSVVSIFAGVLGSQAFTNGIGTSAKFYSPRGIRIDSQNTIYVADYYAIRMISTDGVVTTLIGTGVAGSANGIGTYASVNVIHQIAIDASGNIYVADLANNLIRKVTVLLSPTSQPTR